MKFLCVGGGIGYAVTDANILWLPEGQSDVSLLDNSRKKKSERYIVFVTLFNKLPSTISGGPSSIFNINNELRKTFYVLICRLSFFEFVPS